MLRTDRGEKIWHARASTFARMTYPFSPIPSLFALQFPFNFGRIAAAALVGLFAGCDGRDERGAGSKTTRRTAAVPAGTSRPGLVKQVTTLTEGAHVRIVWVDQRKKSGLDPFGQQDDYRLVGFDNRAGGFRMISGERGNFTRPLLTPDGSGVVFTDRHSGERTSGEGASARLPDRGPYKGTKDAVIKLIPWAGGASKTLGPGFVVALWRDPRSGQDWAYCIDDHISKARSTRTLQTVCRFPLDAPDRREVVWQGTPMSIDNFHISRDGRVFAALFPWPNAGIGEFDRREWRKLDNGCWPALAPDNSRIAWVFDGAHKKVRLFDGEGRRMGLLDLSAAPGMAGQAAYHPRWTNHPRFIVMTGPYPAKRGGREGLERGARHAEVHLGKLSGDCSGFDGWVRLTSNSAGDFYPDAWIEHGSRTVLSRFPQHTDRPIPSQSTAAWPPVKSGLSFVWSDAKAANQLEGHPVAFTLDARGIARPGRFHDLLLDGGWFEADEHSAASWTTSVARSGHFTVQFLLTEQGSGALPDAGVALFQCLDGAEQPLVELRRTTAGLRLHLRLATDDDEIASWSDDTPVETLADGSPVFVAVAWNGRRADWFVDGTLTRSSNVVPVGSFEVASGSTLAFGDPAAPAPPRSWRLEKIALRDEPLEAIEVAQEWHALKNVIRDRRPIAATRLKARVLAATTPEPDRLDVYKRMLVDHTYEVIEVTRGPAPSAKRINVLHWAILDEKLVPGIPRPVDEVVELVIDPLDAHPELESELTIMTEIDSNVPAYHDIAGRDVPDP